VLRLGCPRKKLLRVLAEALSDPIRFQGITVGNGTTDRLLSYCDPTIRNLSLTCLLNRLFCCHRGWLHLPLSKAEEDPLYELLRPRGALMRFLLSRCTDNGLIYEMVPDSLPVRVAHVSTSMMLRAWMQTISDTN